MSKEEVRLNALQIMGFIWDQEHTWGDIHSTEMNKNSDESALAYVAAKINKPNTVGRIGAFQTLCLVSSSAALIPEFCAKGVLISLLHSLHSPDISLKLYAAEILKNFAKYPKLTDYIDSLDLLRNMIDAFYSTEENKVINLLLLAFLRLSEQPFIRVRYWITLESIA
jgi:hypothetical protein